MKFIQFLIVFFAIFFLVRLLFRALLPGLLRMAARKMSSQFSRQYQQYEEPAQQQKVGDVKVEYVPPKKKEKTAAGKKAGDFIEFEELKTKK
ncbi:MAG TPA: DUF4834 family protein [Anseongella sp.]|nr:DUF4834 family protein [Anseongella sp.]